ncbi:hypothetical protein HK096_002272 [Nowakowskiella sp. JEL0078]|nr:hypothetical protein HK096_002272 [Nowakowskiella sp. JEL0078]
MQLLPKSGIVNVRRGEEFSPGVEGLLRWKNQKELRSITHAQIVGSLQLDGQNTPFESKIWRSNVDRGYFSLNLAFGQLEHKRTKIQVKLFLIDSENNVWRTLEHFDIVVMCNSD